MRITRQMLERKVEVLNKLAGTPTTPYTKSKSGTIAPNPGNYHLDWAYGGVQVRQMVESGGTWNPLQSGHESKRKCFDLLTAYISGMREGQK